jgi:hypothetical protein
MTECVFGDWRFSLTAAAVAAYRPGGYLPLTWESYRVVEVPPSTPLSDQRAIARIALAAHWAEAHPSLLAALVGPFELRLM